MQSVNELFVEKGAGKEKSYPLNPELRLQFSGDQEAAKFLVEAFRFWRNKRGFFCHDVTEGWEGEGAAGKKVDLPEDKWHFSYKTPSECSGCVSGQKILDKIFGDHYKFNALPFVTFEGQRVYSFTFDMLKYFADNGLESTVRLIGDRKREVARKESEARAEQQRKLREEQDIKLTERLCGMVISDELRRQILPYAGNQSLVILGQPNVAAVLTSRSEHGSSGGIGYYDQVRVFCGSQSDLKEWQWRDRYSASNDKPWLAVHGIRELRVSEKDNKMNVEVELVNNQHGNRNVTYTFDPPKATAVKTLSVDEQATFTAQLEKEMARIMAEFDRLWERKPKMVATYAAGVVMPMGTPTYVSYHRPSVKQRVFRPEIGVAAFVTEEQIDHHVNDPQIRHELYVLVAGNDKAECKAEDHGYGPDGGAFLTILEVGSESIVINTKRGKATISLR